MRLSKFAAGLGLLCGAVGCHHTSGVCDCIPPIQPCALYGLYPAAGYNPAGGVVATSEAKPAGEAAKADAQAPGTAPTTAELAKEPMDLPIDN
jgi:hypothetical protein